MPLHFWAATIFVGLACSSMVSRDAIANEGIVCAQGPGACVRETDDEKHRRMVENPCFRDIQRSVEGTLDDRMYSRVPDPKGRTAMQIWEEVWNSAKVAKGAISFDVLNFRYENCLSPPVPSTRPRTEIEELRESIEGLREELRQLRRP